MFRRAFSVKANALASLAGNVWAASLSIICVPFYLYYLGIESYGLIGVFTTLLAFLVLLDFGISSTINRELARLSGLENGRQEMHDIAKTLSVLNWITALGIGVLLCLLAPIIARYWIQPKGLGLEVVTNALIIIGINVAIQFVVNFYTGGLMGLQKQVVLSVINGVCGALRSVGALVVLILFSKTIQAFLLWQTTVVLIQVILLIYTLRESLPSGHRGHFKRDLLNNVWRFAAGVTGISIVSLILTQTDKVILSRMVDLEHFGYYMLAVTIASTAISMLVGPLSHAVYPEFSRLLAAKDENGLKEFYHRSCQTVAAVVFPVTAVIVLFSYQILFVWTGNLEIASNTFLILSLVALGSGLNASMWMAHFLQLAHGRTSLILTVGVALVVFITPAIIIGVYFFGAIGGAAGWASLTIVFIPIMVHMMHKSILKGERIRWYLHDFLAPLATAVIVAGTLKMIAPPVNGRFELLVELSLISLFTLAVTMLSTRPTRYHIGMLWKRVLRVHVVSA